MTPSVPSKAVLTSKNTVTCGHTPPGVVVYESASKLQVGSESPVLVAGPPGPTIVPGGCVVQSQGDVPCATVLTVTAGMAKKLRVGVHPVVLYSLAGQTSGTIKGTAGALTVAGGKSKLVAQ
jgi:hypothetical protein